MKNILIILLIFAGIVNAQITGKVGTDITSQGRGANSTAWVQEVVFVDSGATYAGPFSADQPPIGVAITRDAVWDSVTSTTSDDYHWDSTWTASDFAFLLGYKRSLNDSARTASGTTVTDSLDFLPLYNDDGTRYVVQADSMRYIKVKPTDMAGAKYFYLEFYDSAGDSLVNQTEPRTLVLFYRKY
jgi:hypothetical protein